MPIFLLALVGLTAEAGKLADDNGFRGKQFGPATVIDEAPMEGCRKDPETGVRWQCETTLGDHKIVANYMVSEDLFTGVIFTSEGYTSCQGVKDILTMAWGKPSQPNQYIEKFTWGERGVMAAWEYNKVKSDCSVILMNMGVYQEADAKAKAKAANAVNDL